jgi:hypothetical protein
MSVRRFHPSIFWCLGILLLAAAIFAVWDEMRDTCAVTLLQTLPSPGGGWNAVMEESDCGGGETASDEDIVKLAPANGGAQVAILSTDSASRPRLLWTGAGTLQVTVPNLSILSVMTRQVGNVHVNLRFDPPDPAARAEWLRKTGLPADGLLEN